MRSASSASQMSPLPSTGMSSAAASSAIGSQPGLASVEVRRRASVQGHVGHAGVLGPQAGLPVGQMVHVDAEPHLDGDRQRPGGGAHGRA